MTTPNKVSIAVFIGCLLVLAAWGFPILKDRYKAPEKPTQQTTPQNQAPSSPSTDNTVNVPASNDENSADSEDSSDDSVTIEDDNFLDVAPADCANKCKSFTEAEDVKYCKEVCGLATPTKKADGCDAIEDDLEKDYCFKDLAISKNDIKICDQIIDGNVKKTCKNRLLEDIIDKQQAVE
jgi:hypothetical protein